MALPDIEVGDIVTADMLDSLPAGIVGYANRGSTKATAANNTEIGVLRIDAVALKAGHAYEVITSQMRTSAATAYHGVTKLKWTDTGVAATTGATEISRAEGSTSTDSMGPMIGYLAPATDVQASVLLTLQCSTGAVATTLQIDIAGIQILIKDLGLAVPDTGVDL